jgi:hypothetical protein
VHILSGELLVIFSLITKLDENTNPHFTIYSQQNQYDKWVHTGRQGTTRRMAATNLSSSNVTRPTSPRTDGKNIEDCPSDNNSNVSCPTENKVIEIDSSNSMSTLIMKDRKRVLMKENKELRIGMLEIKTDNANDGSMDHAEERASEIVLASKQLAKKARADTAKKNQTKSGKITSKFPKRKYRKVGSKSSGSKKSRSDAKRQFDASSS